MVLTFDLNDLQDLSWNCNRSSVLRFLAGLLTTYQRLGVDLVIQGAADTLVTLPDDRVVLLHHFVNLKGLEEELDDAFWARLAFLMHNRLAVPGEPTCFHPLSADDISRAFDSIAIDRAHSYRTMVWWARHMPTSEYTQFRTPDFIERMADRIDYVFAELNRRIDGTFDTLPSFLPAELRDYGRPGNYLQSVQYD